MAGNPKEAGQEYLQPGRGFYEQEPFNSIFPPVEQATGLDPSKLRRVFTFVAKKAAEGGHFRRTDDVIRPNQGTPIIEDRASQELIEEMRVPSWPFKLVVKDVLKRLKDQQKLPTYLTALHQLGQSLEGEPSFASYININLITPPYLSSGELMPPGHWKFFPTITYQAWKRSREKANSADIKSVVKKSFPQDFAETTDLPEVGQGIKPPTKEWRQRKAADLIRERRSKMDRAT